eukprot:2145591-Rhodomonas_salina.1
MSLSALVPTLCGGIRFQYERRPGFHVATTRSPDGRSMASCGSTARALRISHRVPETVRSVSARQRQNQSLRQRETVSVIAIQRQCQSSRQRETVSVMAYAETVEQCRVPLVRA